MDPWWLCFRHYAELLHKVYVIVLSIEKLIFSTLNFTRLLFSIHSEYPYYTNHNSKGCCLLMWVGVYAKYRVAYGSVCVDLKVDGERGKFVKRLVKGL